MKFSFILPYSPSDHISIVFLICFLLTIINNLIIYLVFKLFFETNSLIIFCFLTQTLKMQHCISFDYFSFSRDNIFERIYNGGEINGGNLWWCFMLIDQVISDWVSYFLGYLSVVTRVVFFSTHHLSVLIQVIKKIISKGLISRILLILLYVLIEDKIEL